MNKFKAETEKCAKKVVVPTKVTEVLQQKKIIALKHLVEESNNKVCMSKMQIPVCAPSSVPKEVVMEEVTMCNLKRAKTMFTNPRTHSSVSPKTMRVQL